MKRAAFVAAVAPLVLAGCATASNCIGEIPEDLRSDTMHYVIEHRLIDPKMMTQDDRILGIGSGAAYELLPPDRKRVVALHAANYVACLQDLVIRYEGR